MMLLLWSCVVVEGKTRSGENSGRAVAMGGSVDTRLDSNSRARLTKRATSLQPQRQPKNNIENHNKKMRKEQR
jgi:hypothetical protein